MTLLYADPLIGGYDAQAWFTVPPDARPTTPPRAATPLRAEDDPPAQPAHDQQSRSHSAAGTALAIETARLHRIAHE